MNNLDKLKEQYEKLGKEIEALENQTKAWTYQGTGTVANETGQFTPVECYTRGERYKIDRCNIYPTSTVGLKMLAWRELEDKMRIAANGYKFEKGKLNTFILFNHTLECDAFSHDSESKIPGVIYFESVTSARAFINSLTKDELDILKQGRPVY